LIFSNFKYCRNSLLKIAFGLSILISLNLFQSNEAQAQDKKSRYEKIQERKNKSNRRLKRRGDKSKKARRSFTKFKIRNRQGDKAYKGDIAGRKVRSRISLTKRSKAAHPQPNPYAGRKRNSEASRAKAFKKSIRYSQKPSERAWKGGLGGQKIRTKGFKSERQRLFPQWSPYKKKRKGSGERDGARFSGQGFKGIRSISGKPEQAKSRKRVVPRSASGAYRVRKREKPYAIREKSKWESAYKGDITGRKFTPKRTNERPVIQAPPKVNYSFRGKGRKGDKAYKGKITGGYKSITSAKEKAWKNDISGTKLRIRTSQQPKFNDAHFKPYPKRKRKGDTPFKGTLKRAGFKTAGRKTERTNKALPQKAPGPGSVSAVRFQGNIKGGKPLKGGGSISDKIWNRNNRKKAIQGKGFNDQDQRVAKFQGNIKGGKPLKDGGSISDKIWNRNNRKKAIQGKGFRDQDQRIAKFQGNLKGGKPLKGGGSISGKTWNNKGKPVQGRGFKAQDQSIAKFQGNIKGGKPLKGGGTIARNQWNNKGKPVQGRGFKDQDQRIAKFQGNLKGGKPLKGGGSVARNQWNNKGKPVQGRGFKDQDQRIAKFQGNIKGGKPSQGGGSIARNQWNNKGKPIQGKGFKTQDEKIAKFQGNLKPRPKTTDQDRQTADFTGNIKQWKYNTGPLDEMKYEGRFKRTAKYKKKPSAVKDALPGRVQGKGTAEGMDFQGRSKLARNYKKKPNAADEALPGIAPKDAASKANRYQGTIKISRNAYKKRPDAADGALPGIGPKKQAITASKYQGTLKLKRGTYKNKPFAADGAMKGIGPSKAAVTASNFQGNIKMRKGRMEDRHPSFKFDKPRDTPIEKTKFSLKLLWSKLFKKSENQPKHLKQKERRPRYDKGEEGLWND